MAEPNHNRGKSKQDYRTPPDLLRAVKARLGITEFKIDLAADEDNTIAKLWYDSSQDALAIERPWTGAPSNGWCWCNPPYANISPWVEKAARESWKGVHVCMLVPVSVGANWWHNWVEPYAYISFLKPRLKFVGATHPYPKDCALLLYTPWGFKGHDIFNWKAKLNLVNGAE